MHLTAPRPPMGHWNGPRSVPSCPVASLSHRLSHLKRAFFPSLALIKLPPRAGCMVRRRCWRRAFFLSHVSDRELWELRNILSRQTHFRR